MCEHIKPTFDRVSYNYNKMPCDKCATPGWKYVETKCCECEVPLRVAYVERGMTDPEEHELVWIKKVYECGSAWPNSNDYCEDCKIYPVYGIMEPDEPYKPPRVRQLKDGTIKLRINQKN